jgi:hypothetical protein
VLKPKAFRVGAYHAAWVFAGGALGAGPRLLVEGVAFRVAPFHTLFAEGSWRSSRGGWSQLFPSEGRATGSEP